MANPEQGFSFGSPPRFGSPPPGLPRWSERPQLQKTKGPSTIHAGLSTQPIPRPLTFESAPDTQPPTSEELRVIRSASILPGPKSTPRVWNFIVDPPSTQMPYNNTAIPPSEEVTGSAALPCRAPHLAFYATLNEVLRIQWHELNAYCIWTRISRRARTMQPLRLL